MKKILFITPYSGRAGAEIYLRRLLEGMDPEKYQCTVLCLNGKGELFQELPKCWNVVVRGEKAFWFRKDILKNKLLRCFSLVEKKDKEVLFFEALQKRECFDLWVVNTIMPNQVQKLAKAMGVRCITLVHEGPHMYSLLTKESFHNIINYSEQIWTCSEKVANKLQLMGAKEVEILHPCFDLPQEDVKKDLVDFKRSLGITNEFVCLSVGTNDPNKGVELIISLAAICQGLRIKFIWVGRLIDSGYSLYLEEMFKHLGLTNMVFVGEQTADLSNYFQIADVLLLPSHYETFSLVALEALSNGKPVIAYEGAAYEQLLNVKNSFVLKTRNPEEWKAKILSLQQGRHSFDEKEIKESVKCFSVARQRQELNSKLDKLFCTHRL